MRRKNSLFGLLALLFLPVIAFAQEGEKSVDEVARELSNPVSSTASLTFQGTWTRWGGDLPGIDEQSNGAIIFMPTLPFKLGSGNLTLRPSFPVASSPVIDGQGGWDKDYGFGDIVLLAIWGRMENNGVLWGAGGTSNFPTASKESLGQDQWQLGPAALIGHLSDVGVFGALLQHWWGLNEPDTGEKVNKGALQLFYWFSLKGGWQIGGSPIATANYVAASDVDFSFPLNLGVAKTFIAGNTPIKATLQGQYFVTQPDMMGPSWGIFFQIAPVVRVPW